MEVEKPEVSVYEMGNNCLRGLFYRKHIINGSKRTDNEMPIGVWLPF